MKAILLIMVIIFLSGCFVVIRDENNVKVYGNRKEIALEAVEKTDQKNPDEKREILKLGK